eukprot:GHVP01034039.1.p1 GENE.GHVP01034039.1~~GHVP01034039.1.p1  ORF type:complete len:113 (-),score=4.31 GHVP01034039.1:127-465(-)
MPKIVVLPQENMFSQLIKSSFSTLASPRHVSYRSTFSTYSLSGITVPPLSLQLDFLHIASIFLKCDVGCSRSIWNMVFSFFNRCLDVRLLPLSKSFVLIKHEIVDSPSNSSL